MEVAAGNIVEEIEKPKPRRSVRLPRTGAGGGNGRGHSGGGGGSEDGPGPDNTFSPDKYRIFTWFLLLVVLMTFGGLISAYIVIATNNVAEWHPSTLPKQLWFSTFIIIASSVTYYFAERSTAEEKQANAKKWLLATTALGVVFVVSQVLAWFDLMARGLFMYGNPYLAFFYILTAVHSVHVIGGLAALSAVLLRSWYPTEDPISMKHRKSLAQVVGWYWHFMGGLWIVIFVLLGFWK